MAIYRTSRNLESSLIDFVTDELTSDWNNVTIVKTYQKVTVQALPIICIRVGNTDFEHAEIGSNSLVRTASIYCDFFATSDGQKEDLCDWFIETIKEGCIFYEYTTTKSGRTTTVTNKTANGRINITDINVSEIDFSRDKNELDPRDRYRTLITLTATLGKVE